MHSFLARGRRKRSQVKRRRRFRGILGAILNSALANQARQEWQNRPVADYSCLEAHNQSADRLAASGIGPNDPRVQEFFRNAHRKRLERSRESLSLATASSGSYNPDFVVDGLALGAAVYPDSPSYKAYKCRPSQEFPGFTWCGIKHPMTGKFGPFDSWTTILHSDANTAVFILQDIVPAYFSPATSIEKSSAFPCVLDKPLAFSTAMRARMRRTR